MDAEKLPADSKSLPKGVYERDDDSPYPNLWIRYHGPLPDGSWGRIRKSSGSSDLRVAVKLREELIRAAKNHRDGIKKSATGSRNVTVGRLLDDLERDHRIKRRKGLRQTLVHMAWLRQHFAFMRASGVTEETAEAYVAMRREEEASDGTIDLELGLLHRSFSLAAGRKNPLVAWVPAVPHLVAKNANARQGFVPRGDFDAHNAELPSQVLRDVAIWAWWTGMRKGEMLSLTWEGYDRETRVIRLPACSAKTGEARLITLDGCPELAAVIERRLKERRLDSPLIFHNGKGGKVGDFYTSWARAIERAGVKPFTIHDLRRTAVRNMVRAGVDRATAKLISGHTTDSMFDRYNIQDERDVAQALEKRAAYEANLPKAEAQSKRGTVSPIGR